MKISETKPAKRRFYIELTYSELCALTACVAASNLKGAERWLYDHGKPGQNHVLDTMLFVFLERAINNANI